MGFHFSKRSQHRVLSAVNTFQQDISGAANWLLRQLQLIKSKCKSSWAQPRRGCAFHGVLGSGSLCHCGSGGGSSGAAGSCVSELRAPSDPSLGVSPQSDEFFFFCSWWDNVSSFCVYHTWFMWLGQRLLTLHILHAQTPQCNTSVDLIIPHLSMEVISLPPWTAGALSSCSLFALITTIFFLPVASGSFPNITFLQQRTRGKWTSLSSPLEVTGWRICPKTPPWVTAVGAQPEAGSEVVKQQKILTGSGENVADSHPKLKC